MVDKIFKTLITPSIFLDFIKQWCFVKIIDDHIMFVLTVEIFKQLKYHHTIEAWYDMLIEHYHISKRYYITRELTYKHFATVIRQLARSLGYRFESKIKYSQSKYTTSYHVYVPMTDMEGWIPEKHRLLP